VIEDVTEARKAEAALREIHERLELAQEAGKIGVFDVDLRSGRILWSSKLSVMMGFAPDKQPLSRDEWLACLHPQDGNAPATISTPASTAPRTLYAIPGAWCARMAKCAGSWRPPASSAMRPERPPGW
jgi:PAS domain-containing protein